MSFCYLIFFFNDTATTEIYTRKDTLSLHDALPIYRHVLPAHPAPGVGAEARAGRSEEHTSELQSPFLISYAVFCLKKKKNNEHNVVFYCCILTHYTILAHYEI